MPSEAETSRHAAFKVVPRDGKPVLVGSVRCVAASTTLGITAWCIAILIAIGSLGRFSGQETPTPSAVPSPSPEARSIRISFVPPPLEGTISLGVFDPSGKLVRVVQREAEIEDFAIGHDALSTTWDGKNDAGESMPAGKYGARGYAVGALEVEGVAYFFNDWVTEEMSPRVKHIGEIRLENNELRVNADLVSGEQATLFCDSLRGTIIRKTSREAIEKCARSAPPAQIVSPLNCSDGKDGSVWFIDNPGEGMAREVKQLSKTHELQRRLAFAKEDPQPCSIAAATTEDRIILLEENETLQRLRGLTLVETKTDMSQQSVSDWKVDFEKKIVAHKDFTIENGKPVAVAAGGKALPEKASVKLMSNPLLNDARPTTELSAGFDAEGSYLKTVDGLPLRTISETPNLTRIVISPRADKVLDVFQDDGAVVEQFRISGADQMMAFDCGVFDLK